jgi:acyl-homoserine lactone acylase PvdQ
MKLDPISSPRHTWRNTGVLACILLMAVSAVGEERELVIYRDTWGVPHVYGASMGEAAYGLGYAQAEDRLEDLFLNVRTAIGSLSEVLGPDYVERDYIMRLVKNAERCEAYWATAPAPVRELGDQFMAGVRTWIAEHPEKVSPFALPLEGWHCLAIGRAMILNWPMEALLGELKNKDRETVALPATNTASPNSAGVPFGVRRLASALPEGARSRLQGEARWVNRPAQEDRVDPEPTPPWPPASRLSESGGEPPQSKAAAAPPFGSNSFAIAPSRSAENCSIVMTDPHLTWEGMAVFYEARVHAGEDAMCGFWLVGSPLPALGHGAHVAFACTTGGPDTSDVFIVKLNPDNPMQYEYEGGWQDFVVEQVSIPVAGGEPVVRPMLYSAIGPVLEAPDVAKGVAYCGASPYLDQVSLLEQQRAMLVAKDVEEFYDALRMNQLMEQNITFADREGNIQYLRNGCTPIRPEGYNWKAPVPWSAESRWLGFHPVKDLVQIKNPPEGYFQNCNNSPEWMLEQSPMTPGKYPDYIYNVTWDDKTPRGVRLLSLLASDESITKDEAKAYTLDVYDIQADAWKEALNRALDAVGEELLAKAEFAEAVAKIRAWDGNFTRDSEAAPLIRFWRLKAEKSGLTKMVAERRPLDEDHQQSLLAHLDAAIGEIRETYGRLDITWGDINLIGRGDHYFACPGAEFGNGPQLARTETVMDVGTRETPPGSGKYVGVDGSSSIMLMFLHPEGIESYSLLNWGQSGDPDSPHYLDQAEKLYAERKFKPTWFKKDDLLPHVESEKILEIKE